MKINNQQKNIPEGWQQVKLGNEIEIFNGGAFNSEDSSSVGIKWLKIANVGVQSIKWNSKSFLPKEYSDEYEKYKLKDGDIVVALTRPTLGQKLKIAKIAKNDLPSLLNQRVGKLKFSKRINHKFGYNFLILDRIAYEINQLLAGTDPPNLSSHAFNYINISLPPFSEQNRIVEVLETWDKYLEELSKKIEVKKKIKKGLMQKLLSGKVKLKGFSREWENVKLESVCNIVKNGIPEFRGIKKYFSTSALLDINKVINISYHERPSRADMYPVISDIGMAKMKGTNRCFLINNKLFKSIFSTGFVFLRHNNMIVPKYLFYSISNNRFQYMKDAYSASGIMGGINNGDLLSIKIKIPKDTKEQQAIAEVLTTADQEIETLEKKKKIIEAQKKYLLNNLITGKIRVLV